MKTVVPGKSPLFKGYFRSHGNLTTFTHNLTVYSSLMEPLHGYHLVFPLLLHAILPSEALCSVGLRLMHGKLGLVVKAYSGLHNTRETSHTGWPRTVTMNVDNRQPNRFA